MEDFEVDFVLDKGLEAREFRLRVQPFTLVGATTRAGMLTAPLRERFGLVGHLAFYSPEELAAIVLRSAGILKVRVEPGGAEEIARRSRGTPRVANRLLRRVRDYAEVRGRGIVTMAIADAALRLEGIDERGLDILDRAYLKTVRDIYRGGPVGVEALSATLNEEVDTLVDVVEPYLLQQGWIARTPAGRKLGPAALKLELGPELEQPSLL
jgi:Holliday junction DNA helicase RuvB